VNATEFFLMKPQALVTVIVHGYGVSLNDLRHSTESVYEGFSRFGYTVVSYRVIGTLPDS
jgi:hypothetical protein